MPNTEDPRNKAKFNRHKATKPGTLLHFPIMINDIVIANVSALNKTQKTGRDDVNVYEIRTTVYAAFNGQGEVHSAKNRQADFEIEHRYGDGAIVLTQKIFNSEQLLKLIDIDPAV